MFKFLAKLKVYVMRTSTYLSIINLILIFLTFKKTYEIQVSSFLLVPIILLFAILIGFLDHKLILRHELHHINKQNNIKDQLDRIENKLVGEN
jgi:hypothetical protein